MVGFKEQGKKDGNSSAEENPQAGKTPSNDKAGHPTRTRYPEGAGNGLRSPNPQWMPCVEQTQEPRDGQELHQSFDNTPKGGVYYPISGVFVLRGNIQGCGVGTTA